MTAMNWHHDPTDFIEKETDEVDEVLAALETLIKTVSSPIVRACLEDARDDIAHLTAQGSLPATETDLEAA